MQLFNDWQDAMTDIQQLALFEYWLFFTDVLPIGDVTQSKVVESVETVKFKLAIAHLLLLRKLVEVQPNNIVVIWLF